MGKPKKRTTARRTRSRRSHLVLKLARQVNGRSPVKAFTTKKEFGRSTTKPAVSSSGLKSKKAETAKITK